MVDFRYIFQSYIDDPTRCRGLLVYEDETALIIKDAFPKALRHYLIIPRSQLITHTHPLDAFKDIKLYDQFNDYVELAKQYICDDLVNVELVTPDDVNEFKRSFIKAGVHSIPSLFNLHIHVITKDFYSPKLKHKKHYNSFNTSFFVEFHKLNALDTDTDYSDSASEDTIYSTDSEDRFERDPAKLEDVIKSTPLQCSTCGKLFDNKFKELKKHLEVEFRKKFDTTKDVSANGSHYT